MARIIGRWAVLRHECTTHPPHSPHARAENAMITPASGDVRAQEERTGRGDHQLARLAPYHTQLLAMIGSDLRE